jgi:sugar phosphate isomerase/epimerase
MKISLVVQAPGIFPSAPLAVLSGTFAHGLQKAASLGVDGLELAVVDPESLDALAIKEQMASCRLAVSAVSSAGLRMATGSSLLHRDAEISRNAIGRLNELIRFAAQVQAPLVTIGSFKGMRGWVEGNGWESLRDILKDAASTAMRLGVRLVIEPLNRTNRLQPGIHRSLLGYRGGNRDSEGANRLIQA